MRPRLLDKVFHKAPRQVGMLVCAESSTFEFHRRLSQTRLGPWTIKFTKAHSELISKYILIHADLFSSWGLFITHRRFNIGLRSVITKDSMVGHNYIMQMTFAVLFELIPSDVSFFYHTPHTSVSPPWLCKLLLSWSPSSWCCLSRLSRRHGPLWRRGGCDARLWHRLCWQLVGTGVHWFYHQTATHIWLPPNAQAWKTCSLHVSVEIDWRFFDTAHWVFVSSRVLLLLRQVPEKSQRRPPCGTMNYSSASPGWGWGEGRLPSDLLPSKTRTTHRSVFWELRQQGDACWRKKPLKRCKNMLFERCFKPGTPFSKTKCILLHAQVVRKLMKKTTLII